jgi:hypothetical protein
MNWNRDWTPESVDEWYMRQSEVYETLDRIEISEPLEIVDGEILDLVIINKELTKTVSAFKQLEDPKTKADILFTTAKRWYRTAHIQGMIESMKMRDTLTNAELQKAYAEEKASEYQGLIDAAKVMKEQIHSERSRLWDYKDVLINLSHNVRKEMTLSNADNYRE